MPSGIVQPPFDTANNVWAFDPDQVGAAQYQVGPTGTVTTPVKTQGTPSFYTFGATDFIDFGNALPSTWQNATGFTLYFTVNPATADVANQRIILSKNASTPTYEWQILSDATGHVFFYTFYSGGLTNFTIYEAAATALTSASKQVIAVTFDPTAVRASRGLIYRNGTALAITAANTGVDGTMANQPLANLRIGRSADAAGTPTTIQSYVYAYNGAHSAGTVASITSWLQTTKGWV